MADLSKIVDDLSSLTVLEAAELTKLLEEKWGVSAAAPVAFAGPMPGAGGGAAAPSDGERGRRRRPDEGNGQRRGPEAAEVHRLMLRRPVRQPLSAPGRQPDQR